jgi:hypothetical protein
MAEAVLASGDLARVRRYVLDAPDLAIQAARQAELFNASARQLSLWEPLPKPSISSLPEPASKEVVNATLWAWPLVVAMSHDIAIRSFFEWTYPSATGLIQKLTQLWAQALGVDPSRIRINCVIHPQLLAGASPLQIQKVLKMSLSQYRSASAREGAHGSHSASHPWAELVGRQKPASRIAGPFQSTSLLLTAVVATDYFEPIPRVTAIAPEVHQALKAILEGVLTHESPHLESARAQNSPTRHIPTIHFGLPALLPAACTQGIAMDMAWMGYRARRCGAYASQELETANGQLHWSSRICNEDGEVLGQVHYYYDNFWHSDAHIETIQAHIDFTQATGRMGSLATCQTAE